ncbi:MAG TPA: hypothetical protein P5511_03465, partial [Candidatus Goldiibacteriota bacterium]|nr:hypothetical protein [Candidatus Goldiibacteriota bacterium]
MIFNLISAAAVVNIVLGILALTKGKNKVNLGFFFLSVLLAAWNLCVVMYSGVGIEAAGKFNYMAISLIPAAGLYFVLAVYNMTTGPVTALPKLLLLPASLIIAVSAGSFFLDGLKPFYESTLFRLIIFAHLFIPLLFAFLILIIKYRGLQYKQERIKIGYIIVAFLILFAGGMIDLADGAKIIETKVKFAGNICNVVYATMIFVAIFRMRLFSVEVLFGNFMTYAVMAIAGGSAFLAVASALKEKFQAMAAVFFMMMFVIVYYAGKLKGLAFEFREKIGVVSGAEEARRACNRITISQAEEGIKILDTLLLVEKHLNMSAAVFMRGGDYYMAAWETGGGFYNKLVEGSLVQKDVIVRYEVSEKKQTDLLDRFGADIVVPVIYRDSVIGVLAARKHSSDISMSQDEVDVLVEMASNIAVYMKSKQVQEKQVEDENMRRLGMMAGQMAHEIKNPLTALWGAAQLIEGKDENDRENLGIIK